MLLNGQKNLHASNVQAYSVMVVTGYSARENVMKSKTNTYLLKFASFFVGFHAIYFVLIWHFPLLGLSSEQAYKLNEFLVALGNADNIEAYYDAYDLIFIFVHVIAALLILTVLYFSLRWVFRRYL